MIALCRPIGLQGAFCLGERRAEMLRKLFFYSNVVVASIILPIIGVLVTVGYTIFVIVRAIFRSILGLFQGGKLANKPRGA